MGIATDIILLVVTAFFCGLVMLLFSVLPVFLGMAAFAIFPDFPFYFRQNSTIQNCIS